ncbi:Copper-exporting P-type ATPase B [uncultured archaeon]|nr:Copper-exporting P-type ATPase B [uncultured archaeon]
MADVVPGDVVILRAGDIIPGDSLIFESKDLFVNEATLTGETYPAEKAPGMLSSDIPLAKRSNSLFMGTSVVSGTARALVVHTGVATEFGQVSQRLRLAPEDTDFERGVKSFGYFLMHVTLLLVVAIFAVNVYLQKPVIDSFLFSLALAVGLTPQLLPAIISVNLAQGAKRMAAHKVIVKRLASIENFGSMNVLCTDKTGTLTEGRVQLKSALDVSGKESEKVLRYAYINSFYETGFNNPIDQAVLTSNKFDLTGVKKLDEVPYDFIRKRLSILVSLGGANIIITKGALDKGLEVCTRAETPQGPGEMGSIRGGVEKIFQDLSRQGVRVLGLSYKKVEKNVCLTRDEADMTFLGFLAFFDPLKEGIEATVKNLNSLGISLKVITGDNKLVAASVGRQVGLSETEIVSGRELRDMSDEALLNKVGSVDIFAEVEPNQKERIITAARKRGYVVGYMGDGINDASALRAADIGMSVEGAVDVAKEAADVVLLEKDLSVLSEGVIEGRKTFANTMKYVFMATSANFGNMFSMSLISLVIPFLPMLPTQVLLTNLLTDLPELTIASDNVDPELISQPQRWSIGFIRTFMMVFGLLSSIFDCATFVALLLILHVGPAEFRTGWFTESVISASMVVLIIRTRRPFFKSKPSSHLLGTTIAVAAITLLIPYSPLAGPFEFVKLPAALILMIVLISAVYVVTAEMVKKIFYKSVLPG